MTWYWLSTFIKLSGWLAKHYLTMWCIDSNCGHFSIKNLIQSCELLVTFVCTSSSDFFLKTILFFPQSPGIYSLSLTHFPSQIFPPSIYPHSGQSQALGVHSDSYFLHTFHIPSDARFYQFSLWNILISFSSSLILHPCYPTIWLRPILWLQKPYNYPSFSRMTSFQSIQYINALILLLLCSNFPWGILTA